MFASSDGQAPSPSRLVQARWLPRLLRPVLWGEAKTPTDPCERLSTTMPGSWKSSVVSRRRSVARTSSFGVCCERQACSALPLRGRHDMQPWVPGALVALEALRMPVAAATRPQRLRPPPPSPRTRGVPALRRCRSKGSCRSNRSSSRGGLDWPHKCGDQQPGAPALLRLRSGPTVARRVSGPRGQAALLEPAGRRRTAAAWARGGPPPAALRPAQGAAPCRISTTSCSRC